MVSHGTCMSERVAACKHAGLGKDKLSHTVDFLVMLSVQGEPQLHSPQSPDQPNNPGWYLQSVGEQRQQQG